ncbi:MAG: hypothetical protein JW746_07310 [Candidatus Krumholzibacteriota bacterium]|nr:hypothetical protein [Candidatus Krumholzibacteriota bacterium]
MRNYRESGLIAVTCIFMLLTFADGKTEEVSLETTEYELMSLIIEDEYEGEFSPILINSETESWCLGGQLGILQKTWPELKNETIDALIVNNRGATCRLEKQFRLPVEYRLLSEQEYLKVLQIDRTLNAGAASAGAGNDQYASPIADAGPDWDNFDRLFPESQGYLTFSRAGFDSEGTQALVIFCNSYRCNGARVRPATRKIACFMKRKGVWELAGVSCSINIMY